MSRGRIITLAAVLLLGACGAGETTDTTESTAPDLTVADTVSEPPPADTVSEPPTADTVPAEELETSSAAPELIGIEWNVAFIGLERSFTNVWPDTEITLVFDSTDSLSGFSGCNDYTASYEVEGEYRETAVPFDDSKRKGQVIRITDISADEAVCEDKVMEQETDYFNDLRDSDRWYISERTLTLASNNTGMVVETEPSG